MSRVVVLLLLLCAPALALADEPAAKERVFIEYVVPRTAYFVGEEIPVLLRFGYMPEFFEQRGVALFRQEVDVPLHVRAAFDLDVAKTRSLPARAPDTEDEPEVIRFALDDDIVEGSRVAEVQREGRTYTVVEIERRLLAEEVGRGRLMAPRLRFAHATKFRENFLGGRTPLDRVDVEIKGRGVDLRILPLPESGRPPAFIDAVGQFTVRASHERKGGTPPLLHVTLEIAGTGNLATLTPPPAQVFEGFHAYGVRSTQDGGVRRVRYELAPLSEQVHEIPAIPFAFLDPGPPAAYRELATEAMPLEGRVPAAVEAKPIAEADVPRRPAPADDASSLLEWLLVASVMGLLALSLWLWRRGAQEPVVDDGRAEPLAALRASLANDGRDAEDHFHTYVARALGAADAAVIGPELETRLGQRGVESNLARRVARHVEATVGARYGGAPAPRLEAGLVDELEAAFTAAQE